MDEPGFSVYQEQFAAAVGRRGGVIRRLANGGCLAEFGRKKGPLLAVVSGVHGDERSGPLALQSFVKEASLEVFRSDGPALWLVPLLNDDGWDNNTREWKGVNLNSAFIPDSPVPFVAEMMRHLAARVPQIFLDLHEDSEKPYPYVYRFTDDRQDFTLRLRDALGAGETLWSPGDEERWIGSTEIFVRQLGCERSVTIEAPPVWPMQARIAWNALAVRYCVTELRRLTGT